MTHRKTRELILATSLALFNELGEPNVTTNHVADEAGISPGNLYYHFRNREDIALELFKRYLLEIRPLLVIEEDAEPSMEDLWLRLHLVFELMGRYRFLFRNLTDLCARISNLQRAVHALLDRQRKALLLMIESLRRQGIIHIDGHETDNLVETMLLIITCWIPFAQASSNPGLADGQAQSDAVAQLLHLILPYLREPEASQVETLAHSYRET
ncbi:MAG: TetR/AcrR family transcriptional regulator [Lysobacterales bacterium]|jgi:AcrR family transcriptional regulator